jgi:choline dehydrogenase-like flavoprotein
MSQIVGDFIVERLHAGTVRMGDDPRASVVNADCRSWDIPNLRICDGSVFQQSAGSIRR